MIRRAVLLLTGCALLTVGCMPSPVIRRTQSPACLQALAHPPARPVAQGEWARLPEPEREPALLYEICSRERDDIARNPVWHLSPEPSTVAAPVRCIRLPDYMVTCY